MSRMWEKASHPISKHAIFSPASRYITRTVTCGGCLQRLIWTWRDFLSVSGFLWLSFQDDDFKSDFSYAGAVDPKSREKIATLYSSRSIGNDTTIRYGKANLESSYEKICDWSTQKQNGINNIVFGRQIGRDKHNFCCTFTAVVHFSNCKVSGV